VMEGAINEIIVALQKADYEEKLAALTGSQLPGAIPKVRRTSDDE
jgi:peptide chain release factor 1